MHIITKWKLLTCIIILGGLGGCAVTPEPIGTSESRERANRDLETMFEEQEPVTHAISLYEAMARALKYNMEYRVQLMQKVVSNEELNLSRYDLLPQVAANAGYTNRNNTNASNSLSVTTGRESLETSTSQEKELLAGQAQVVWNVLDFGVSYLRQQQAADKTLIREEQRRKVVQNIIQETRTAYWRAVAAGRITGELEGKVKEVRSALDTARRLQEEAIRPPLAALEFRRDLLKTLRALLLKKDELAMAKSELARLMNLPPHSNFSVVMPEEKSLNGKFSMQDLSNLQLLALIHRPELIEMDYNARILEKEGTIAKLELLPGIKFNGGLNYDSNSFLLNQSWYDIGVRISFDLVRLATISRVNDLNEKRQQLADLQRKALTSAVLTQVDLSIRTYLTALRDYNLSRNAAEIEQNRYQQYSARETSGAGERLELIQSDADALLASLDRHFQYARVQDRFGLILNSLGIDPVPDTVSDHDLDTLTSAMRNYFETELPGQITETMNSFE